MGTGVVMNPTDYALIIEGAIGIAIALIVAIVVIIAILRST